MPRPPLDIGKHGSVSYRAVGPRKVRALVWVCDADGRVRQVTRVGTSRQDALSRLQEALTDRPGYVGADITGESRLSDAAAGWLAEIQRMVTEGSRAPNTARLYGLSLSVHVLPAVGHLRLREATTPRLSGFLVELRRRQGASSTKTARTVLRGLLEWAKRQGAIDGDPMRGVARIAGPRGRPPRAMTSAERDAWVTAVDADVVAVRHDLPDLTRWMLATGCRIGEALAVTFGEVDVDGKTVRIDWTIVRVTGEGLVRVPTKTAAGQRTLRLPGWAVDVVVRRGDRFGWAGPLFPAVATRQGAVRTADGSFAGFRRGAGGWRDPSNVAHQLRAASDRAGLEWVTSHVFRKTVATVLDESGLTAREIADQLGHARPTITQDVYMGRKAVGDGAAVALGEMFGAVDSASSGPSGVSD